MYACTGLIRFPIWSDIFSSFYKLTVFSMCNVFSFARMFGENGRTIGQKGRKMADDQLLFIALPVLEVLHSCIVIVLHLVKQHVNDYMYASMQGPPGGPGPVGPPGSPGQRGSAGAQGAKGMTGEKVSIIARLYS